MHAKNLQLQQWTFYLDKKIKASRESAINVARSILETSINDLVIDVETDHSTEIILEFDSERLRNRNCTMEDVISVLESNKKFTQKAVKDNVIITLVEESDSITVNTLLNKIRKTIVKGVPEIERVTLKEENGEWVIQTTGSNLLKVLEVEGIDKYNVRTNNIFEIAIGLGIEAARNSLISELKATLENQGLEVDIRYLMLVADLMCNKGHLQQIGTSWNRRIKR